MRREFAERIVIGVDIGGTKVAAGLVNSRGKILGSVRTPMSARGSADEGLRAVNDGIDELMRKPAAKSASAIGISVPGWIDATRGALLSATNIPCWRDFPLAEKISKRYRLRTRIANDANVAALAEAMWGPGKGYENVFYVTLGTGIGAGIVLGNKVYEGRTGGAGEGGHMTIDFQGPLCGCGKRGCIEAYASGTAIAKRARQRLSAGESPDSSMPALAGGKIEAVTSEIVAKAAAHGDRLAVAVLNDAAERLAIWMGNIVELLEPDVIVVGGGVGHLMMSYAARIRESLQNWAINPRSKQIPIVEAKYGPESAMVGAAALWMSDRSSRPPLRPSGRKT